MASGQPTGPSSLTNPTNSAPSPHLLKSHAPPLIQTFSTHLVLPFSISIAEFVKQGQGRAEASGEIRETFTRLVKRLESKGLSVTARRGRGKLAQGKEVWVFVSAPREVVSAAWEREREEDRARGGQPAGPLTEADEIRLVHGLLVDAPEQGGLGITPDQGEWRRVKAIVAVHDEQANHRWVQSWIGKEWWVGLRFGKDDSDKVQSQFGHSIACYFSFLSFYTLSLLPLSIFGLVFWAAKLRWSPWYALGVSLWGVIVVEAWRVQESRLQRHFGVQGVERREHLRAQYLEHAKATGGAGAIAYDLAHGTDRTRAARESKMLLSIPVVLLAGTVLGGVVTLTFILEAFLAHLYDGPGKQVLALVPTMVFVGVVPTIVGYYHDLTLKMTDWENHPTKASYQSSLTVKTFALNAVTAYLGLFLSAYVYVPFGELIMSYFSIALAQDQHFKHTTSADNAGLSPNMPIGRRVGIKNDRLVNQMFAYTVTNQAINAFQELGLPFIMRYINAWRDNSSLPIIGSAKGKASEEAKAKSSGTELHELDKEVTPEETKFLNKIGRELSLPEYSIFVDYAEMVTQYGYITLWSIIWPIAPIFAFLNNYVELRSDAVKICSHVRRPIADREASVGVWLDAMTFLTWLATITNATLVYLFRPSLDDPVHAQSINPDMSTDSFSTYGANFLHAAVTHNTTVAAGLERGFIGKSREVARIVLPSLIPVLFVALSASHAYLAVRWIVRLVVNRVLQQQTMQVARSTTAGPPQGGLSGQRADATGPQSRAFWRGTSEGLEEVNRVLKSE